MNYEKALEELKSVLEHSENSSHEIFEKLESLSNTPASEISEIIHLIQSHDIYTQKIQRVMNFLCEDNNLDSSKYCSSPSAKHIDGDINDVMSDEDIEALIKQMA